jgi:chemotaxis protein MotA
MSKRRFDRSTILGVLISVSGVVTGLVLDGGSVKQILQPSAALIVLAGTLGAVMIQFPMETVIDSIRLLPHVIFERGPVFGMAIEELVAYCTQVRRHGILRLDAQLEEMEDRFLRKAFTMAVDGAQIRTMRESMELESDLADERESSIVKVLEAAGGFAPTLGIMGAVLGLIQVMQKMDNVAEIGKGIAVAFVSTLYGLGLANLLFLPLAGKMRIRMRERHLVREMMVEAVGSIMDGIGPRALKEKLDCYISENAAKNAATLPAPEMAAR